MKFDGKIPTQLAAIGLVALIVALTNVAPAGAQQGAPAPGTFIGADLITEDAEAASRFYFGKPALEMDLAESALMAGLIQRPEGHSPFRDPEQALRRRAHVLRRMVHEGYISEALAADAARAPR